jgi:hypothetical protein
MASYPLRLLMLRAQEELQRDGHEASLQDAADALGRGRRRVTREYEATNVQTATLQEALATWRSQGREELEIVVRADGVEVHRRASNRPHVVVDVLSGSGEAREGRRASHVLLHPDRSTVAASLLSARVLHEDLERLQVETNVQRVLLVRLGWSGPLLQRRLVAEVVLDAHASGLWSRMGEEGRPVDVVALERLLNGGAVDEQDSLALMGLQREAHARIQVFPVETFTHATWALILCAGLFEPGVLPRTRAALPGIRRGVADVEVALR